jgi:hypothetical protein
MGLRGGNETGRRAFRHQQFLTQRGAALPELARWMFDTHDVERLEGTTRLDSVAMRRTFRAVGPHRTLGDGVGPSRRSPRGRSALHDLDDGARSAERRAPARGEG